MGVRKLNQFTVLVMGVCLSGCLYLAEIVGLGPEKPVAHLEAVELVAFGLNTFTLEAVIRIENPNGYDLELNRLDYWLAVAELDVAKGVFKGPYKIAGERTQLLRLPIEVDTKKAMKVVENMLSGKAGTMATLTGQVDFSTPYGSADLEFHETRDITKR